MEVIRTGDDGNGGTSVINDDVAYLESTEFSTVEDGLQSFQVNIAGSEDVLLSIPDVNLASGGVYTIVTRGFYAPPADNNNNLSAQILINY